MDSQNQGKENCQVLQPSSPNFLKPKPLKLRRKPRRILTHEPLKEIDINGNKNVHIGYLVKSPKKALNPFKCLDNKRKRQLENDDESSNSLLWQMTNNKVISSCIEPTRSAPAPIIPSDLDEDAHFGFGETSHSSWLPEKNKVPVKTKHKNIPVDWSLKTKIRLTSPKPFPWRTSFKTSEEASGTTGFVRCLYADKNNKKPCSLDSSHGAKFFQQSLVWMHPSLPWLNLFPRTESPSFKNNNSTVTLSAPVLETLHSKWCDSFRSLYQLVRTRQCPYFYLCAPSFTALFRSSGVASILDLHAIITPTTKGLRNALTEEGIAFRMPLCQNAESGSLLDGSDDEISQLTLNEDTEKEENACLGPSEETNEPDAEDEPEVWLESLGLSQENFPSLKKKRKNKVKIDQKPESLVYVEGNETQALVNFLLNSPSCVSKVGLMAGIPPTLLSPTAFLGATLHPLKIHHGKVRSDKKELDTVELSGPILPSTVHSLCSLFSATQDGSFSAVLTPHTPTLAFSLFTVENATVPSVFATENLKDCGLPGSFIGHMCSKNETNSTLASISVEEGLFTWA